MKREYTETPPQEFDELMNLRIYPNFRAQLHPNDCQFLPIIFMLKNVLIIDVFLLMVFKEKVIEASIEAICS